MAAGVLPATESTSPGFAGAWKIGSLNLSSGTCGARVALVISEPGAAYLDARESSGLLTLVQAEGDVLLALVRRVGDFSFRAGGGVRIGGTGVPCCRLKTLNVTLLSRTCWILTPSPGRRPRRAGILMFTSDKQLSPAHICLPLEQSACQWDYLLIGLVSGNSALLAR